MRGFLCVCLLVWNDRSRRTPNYCVPCYLCEVPGTSYSESRILHTTTILPPLLLPNIGPLSAPCAESDPSSAAAPRPEPANFPNSLGRFDHPLRSVLQWVRPESFLLDASGPYSNCIAASGPWPTNSYAADDDRHIYFVIKRKQSIT